MTESELKQWGEKDFSNRYLDIAEVMVIGRKRSLKTLQSFYRHFMDSQKPNTVLDLGCGDGVITDALLSIDNSISATLVDGSTEMLNKARQRFSAVENFSYINSTFQDLMRSNTITDTFDLAVSSLAIHHLSTEQKKDLFRYIYSHLKTGSYFINIDVVRSHSDAIEKWHIELWKEGFKEQAPPDEMESVFKEMVITYTEKEHYANVDTLKTQMEGLKEAGFQNIDCFFKRGMFAAYGGRK